MIDVYYKKIKNSHAMIHKISKYFVIIKIYAIFAATKYNYLPL